MKLALPAASRPHPAPFPDTADSKAAGQCRADCGRCVSEKRCQSPHGSMSHTGRSRVRRWAAQAALSIAHRSEVVVVPLWARFLIRAQRIPNCDELCVQKGEL